MLWAAYLSCESREGEAGALATRREGAGWYNCSAWVTDEFPTLVVVPVDAPVTVSDEVRGLAAWPWICRVPGLTR